MYNIYWFSTETMVSRMHLIVKLYVLTVPVLLGAFTQLRKATISFVLSVLMEQLGSRLTDFHDIGVFFFENLSRKFTFH